MMMLKFSLSLSCTLFFCAEIRIQTKFLVASFNFLFGFHRDMKVSSIQFELRYTVVRIEAIVSRRFRPGGSNPGNIMLMGSIATLWKQNV